MPRLDGDQLDLLLYALNRLAKDKDELITHVTLIEYVQGALPPTTKTTKPFAHNKRKNTQQQKLDSEEMAISDIAIDQRKVA